MGDNDPIQERSVQTSNPAQPVIQVVMPPEAVKVLLDAAQTTVQPVNDPAPVQVVTIPSPAPIVTPATPPLAPVIVDTGVQAENERLRIRNNLAISIFGVILFLVVAIVIYRVGTNRMSSTLTVPAADIIPTSVQESPSLFLQSSSTSSSRPANSDTTPR